MPDWKDLDMHLTEEEVILLFGSPRAKKFDEESSIQLNERDISVGSTGRWAIFAEFRGGQVTIAPDEVVALARRILSHRCAGGIHESDALILQRRAENLLDISESISS